MTTSSRLSALESQVASLRALVQQQAATIDELKTAPRMSQYKDGRLVINPYDDRGEFDPVDGVPFTILGRPLAASTMYCIGPDLGSAPLPELNFFTAKGDDYRNPQPVDVGWGAGSMSFGARNTYMAPFWDNSGGIGAYVDRTRCDGGIATYLATRHAFLNVSSDGVLTFRVDGKPVFAVDRGGIVK